MRPYAFWTLILALAFLPGCLDFEANDRSAEENQETGGWQDRGQNPGSWNRSKDLEGTPGDSWEYQVHYESVIISPDGQWLFTSLPLPGPDKGFTTPGVALCAKHLTTGKQHCMPTALNVRRIGFSPDGLYAFALSETGGSVHELHLPTLLEAGGQSPIKATYQLPQSGFTAIDISPDGRYVVASNVPTTDAFEALWNILPCIGSQCILNVIDRERTSTKSLTLNTAPRDLDFSPFRDELLITTSTHLDNGTPQATVHFIELPSVSIVASPAFPNCADELVLQPDGALALLAPISCNTDGPATTFGRRGSDSGIIECATSGDSYDPISVLNLDTRDFITNLPGYGPVDISPDGKTAVGFTRKQDMEDFWSYPQALPVGLIKVDLDTLDWSIIEYGNREPAYWIAPDAVTLYTYEDGLICEDTDGDPCTLSNRCTEVPANASRISLETGQRVPMSDDSIQLKHFVVTPDGQTIISLQEDAIASFTTGSTEVDTLDLTLEAHNRLGVRPQNDYLLVGKRNAAEYDLVDLTTFNLFHTVAFDAPSPFTTAR